MSQNILQAEVAAAFSEDPPMPSGTPGKSDYVTRLKTLVSENTIMTFPFTHTYTTQSDDDSDTL